VNTLTFTMAQALLGGCGGANSPHMDKIFGREAAPLYFEHVW
jgi:hypothetical protein